MGQAFIPASVERNKTASFVHGEVITDHGDEVTVVISGIQRRAIKAMPMQYMAEPGDLLLVAAQGDDAYVIGVLQGRGACRLSNEGDLELESRSGAVKLHAAESMEITTRMMSVRALAYELISQTIIERTASISRWVAGLVHDRLGAQRTEVSQRSELVAESVSVQAAEKVKVDGKRIDLG